MIVFRLYFGFAWPCGTVQGWYARTTVHMPSSLTRLVVLVMSLIVPAEQLSEQISSRSFQERRS